MRLPGKVTTKNIKNKSKKQMQLQIKLPVGGIKIAHI